MSVFNNPGVGTKESVTLLLSVPNVSVAQIYEGESVPLAEGTLELSLIPAEPDHFLVLKLNDVEIALTPDSQVFKKGDTGLYVPWTELPGALLCFDLSACHHEMIETLDTYLVDLTAMPAPESGLRNQLALVDDKGQVVGGVDIDQVVGDVTAPIPPYSPPSTSAVGGFAGQPLQRTDSYSKAPVQVDISPDGRVKVEPFGDSKIVKGSSYISSGILYSAAAISDGMTKGSTWLNSRTPATERDVEFSKATKASTRKVHEVTMGVSHVSAKTFGYVSSLAEKAGGRIVGGSSKSSSKKKSAAYGNNHDGTGSVGEDGSKKKPGILAHAAYALVTVLDAVDAGGKQVISSASQNVTSVVQHRYGSQAGTMADELGGSVKNVALVYFDAKGVSHRALLKSGLKGGVRARMSDGSQVVLNNEQVPTAAAAPSKAKKTA